MAEKKQNLAEQIASIAKPVADELGLELWDVFYGKEGQDMILRITIDKAEGVFISDCEALSRAVDPLIDDSALINTAYRFEVSSPGLGRRLRTDEHLTKYLGKPVSVHLIRPDEKGEKDYLGTLESFDSSLLSVSGDSGIITIDRNTVSYVKADDDTF